MTLLKIEVVPLVNEKEKDQEKTRGKHLEKERRRKRNRKNQDLRRQKWVRDRASKKS